MSAKSSVINDLTQGSETKQLLVFSFPFIIANILLSGYNILDMIIVGQAAGNAGIVAMSVGGDLTFFLTCLCIGFSMAV